MCTSVRSFTVLPSIVARIRSFTISSSEKVSKFSLGRPSAHPKMHHRSSCRHKHYYCPVQTVRAVTKTGLPSLKRTVQSFADGETPSPTHFCSSHRGLPGLTKCETGIEVLVGQFPNFVTLWSRGHMTNVYSSIHVSYVHRQLTSSCRAVLLSARCIIFSTAHFSGPQGTEIQKSNRCLQNLLIHINSDLKSNFKQEILIIFELQKQHFKNQIAYAPPPRKNIHEMSAYLYIIVFL